MTILNDCANDNDERTLLGANVVGKAITYFPWNKIQVHVPPYSLNNFPNIPQNVTKYIEKKRKANLLWNYWTELHKHAIKGKAKFFLSILSIRSIRSFEITNCQRKTNISAASYVVLSIGWNFQLHSATWKILFRIRFRWISWKLQGDITRQTRLHFPGFHVKTIECLIRTHHPPRLIPCSQAILPD